MLSGNGPPLICDGAIGEYLFSLGFPSSYLACEAVIRAPEILASVHREYAEAGAQVLTTNTFDANAVKLDMRGLADRCVAINRSAAAIARRNSGVLVAGAVGPLSQAHSFRPAVRDPEILERAFAPQVEGLLEGGVDFVLLETQVDPEQTRLILDVVRRASSDIPVAISFTFGPELLTPSGFSIEDCVRCFEDTGITALGANHGVGPLQFLEIYRRLRGSSPFPVLLEPNSGMGRYVDGSFVFPDNPEHFTKCMLSCAGEETAFIGGCCGTTPLFISLLASRLADAPPVVMSVKWEGNVDADRPVERVPENPPPLAADLAGKDALIVELLPPRGGDMALFRKRAERLCGLAPVTVSIPDSPMGRVRISPGLAGLYLKEQLGMHPLVHFALRDRSLTRVQSDLLGMAAAGIKGVFLISGDPPSLGDYPEATAVYDLTTDESLELVTGLAMGKDFNGRSIGSGGGLFPGSAVILGDPATREKMERRWDLGCRFFITQPVYSRETLEESASLLQEYPVVVALMPFRTGASAAYLASEVPGINVPESIMSAMADMDDESVRAFSVDLLDDLSRQLNGLASGIYLAGPFGPVMELGLRRRGLK